MTSPPNPPPLPEDIKRGIESAKAEAEAQAKRGIESAKAEAEAQAKREQAERQRKQEQRLTMIKDEAERELAAAITHGGIALEDIDPKMLRSPPIMEALEVARLMREVIAQASVAAHLQRAIDRVGEIIKDPNAPLSLVLRAAEVIATIHFKLASKPSLSKVEALRAVLVAEGASVADVAKMTTAELERRVAELTRGGQHGRN
jgi:hypothetical protein